MTGIRFEDPPTPHRRGPSKEYQAIAEALRARPGEWAIIHDHAAEGSSRNVAVRIKNGTCRAFRPAGAFDAVSRRVEGRFRVYARYTGGAQT